MTQNQCTSNRILKVTYEALRRF